ncbi:DNA repair protein RecN [Haematospirillum sp. H1815]|uniref:DNA repair protein RecN n=1 Tax=Haematospirillum sp. H1815 TaxID=2723108 RepID=UPI001438AC6C|nr:DNA repair protein RecN [Haematospirillum sp. H1815]NKD76728.1 DNA repair protein RecN [Haematospirillum sp. H1815]
MLVRLSIRDVVLIERLDLTFGAGLGVLTGETGAGKSILLDSLGLALGERGDSALVRNGSDQLSVTAAFDLPAAHPALLLAREQGLDSPDGEELVLRRTVSRDGRSRAFVNDQSASIGLLRQLGRALTEIHGQFDAHGLLDPSTHRGALDEWAGTGQARRICQQAWQSWNTARTNRLRIQEGLDAARREEDILRHHAEELAAVAPKADEENSLAEQRQLLMNREKLAEGLETALRSLAAGGSGVDALLRSVSRQLERLAPMAGEVFHPVIECLDRAALETTEAHATLERISSALDLDPGQLEYLEDRLFTLRSLARKHHCRVDDLPAVLESLHQKLRALDDGGADVAQWEAEERRAREAYQHAAQTLSNVRVKAAGQLDKKVAAELPPLKLDRARFVTRVEELPENRWGPDGTDLVTFEVATNPGATPGPIGRIASGGELSRFMLALKVVLARSSTIPTLVFDEVDTGIGGATAAAVGERLARLAADVQVLVVTHSPQVAAQGTHHWRVVKTVRGGKTTTGVELLDETARREEIARMLAGETITEQARAAADSLMHSI